MGFLLLAFSVFDYTAKKMDSKTWKYPSTCQAEHYCLTWQDYGAHCPVYLQAIKPSMFIIVKVDYLFILLLGLSSLYRLHQPLYLSVSLPYILYVHMGLHNTGILVECLFHMNSDFSCLLLAAVSSQQSLSISGLLSEGFLT